MTVCFHQRILARRVAGVLSVCAVVLAAGCGEDPVSLNGRALAEMERGNLDAAAELLRKAAELAPDEPVLQANLAEAYSRLGEFNEAYRHQLRCVELGEGADPAQLRRLAEILLLARRPRETIGPLESLWEENPDDPGIGYALCIGYLLLNDEASARGLLAQCRKLFPEEPRFQTLEGRFALRGGDLERARSVLEEVVKRVPDYAEANLLLGDLLLESGEYARAAELYAAALAAGANPEISLKLGKARSRLGEAESAEATLTEAARGEYQGEALLELAGLYLRNPDDAWGNSEALSRAFKACDQILEADPLNVSARNLKAMVYARRRQLGPMLNEFRKSLSINPEQPAIRNIVEMYEDSGDR